MTFEVNLEKDSGQKIDDVFTVAVNADMKKRLLEVFGSGKRLSAETRRFWEHALKESEKKHRKSS